MSKIEKCINAMNETKDLIENVNLFLSVRETKKENFFETIEEECHNEINKEISSLNKILKITHKYYKGSDKGKIIKQYESEISMREGLCKSFEIKRDIQ